MRTMDKVTCKESCSVWPNTVLCVQNNFQVSTGVQLSGRRYLVRFFSHSR